MKIHHLPTTIPLHYASLSRRVLALALDGAILALPCALAAGLVPVLGPLVVLFFYAPVLEASELRATLGKHLAGIQVADLAGRRLSFRAALLRSLLKSVSSALLLLGYVLALFSERRQTLHDLLTESVVVYGRSHRPILDAWLEEVRQVLGRPSTV